MSSPLDAFNKSVETLMSSDQFSCVRMPNIHFWKNTKSCIIGGYYDIVHHRYFRVKSKIRYKQNHNFPEDYSGQMLNFSVAKYEKNITIKNCTATWSNFYIYHMGFAKGEDDMNDKTQYYVNRGEKSYRPQTTLSRAAWFDDKQMPKECKIYSFNQSLPVVLSA